jgi:hypothetical protein
LSSTGKPQATSERLPFLAPLRCWFILALMNITANCQSSAVLYADKENEQIRKQITYLPFGQKMPYVTIN